ncbi:uncharacterized protein PHACADRAFT_246209 [Phanerochaete carnosa HHB-10118-sp]|uniref:BTB domain-containing protein n=1 Tax=Phanerochaete carnosa (strain HHB-10118-sp) TaxID=650164 RepID=K5WLR4_PHACS|nr:uncharacterized protein PHACADRAFT_246209 [Phanerochaete carnosa HHB-10118-sp]EKM60345.1 hypothetical protein PHACADRAFT_246209 [Phanerochaete carnosa HHB-10118-sp]
MNVPDCLQLRDSLQAGARRRNHRLRTMQANVDTKLSSQQHRSLYFPDGDDMLCAVSVSDKSTIPCCVHRIVLLFHSLVFRDMFTLFTNFQVNETLDDAPVVRL